MNVEETQALPNTKSKSRNAYTGALLAMSRFLCYPFTVFYYGNPVGGNLSVVNASNNSKEVLCKMHYDSCCCYGNARSMQFDALSERHLQLGKSCMLCTSTAALGQIAMSIAKLDSELGKSAAINNVDVLRSNGGSSRHEDTRVSDRHKATREAMEEIAARRKEQLKSALVQQHLELSAQMDNFKVVSAIQEVTGNTRELMANHHNKMKNNFEDAVESMRQSAEDNEMITRAFQTSEDAILDDLIANLSANDTDNAQSTLSSAAILQTTTMTPLPPHQAEEAIAELKYHEHGLAGSSASRRETQVAE